MVDAVYAEEGQHVAAGAPLLELRNLPLQARVSRADADYATATKRATAAILRFRGVGATAADRDRLGAERTELLNTIANLKLSSPISGTVLTPRLPDQLGSYIKEGTELVEVADLTQMRARIYISEYDLYKCRAGSPARVQIDGMLKIRDAQAQSITEASWEIDSSLTAANKLKGLNPPSFYLVDLLLDNSDGRLKPGMRGQARIYGRRRSIAALTSEGVAHFVGRKLW